MRSRKVAHLTSAHSRHDIRIFHKECKTLSFAGYSVVLVVADGLGSESVDGIAIRDVGKRGGRLRRMLFSTLLVLKEALRLDADIYHFHDPELIPAGLFLRLYGNTVIFDAHEDVTKQLLSKPYLGPFRLCILSKFFSIFERVICRFFSGIATATPVICDKFRRINPRTMNINNFPLLGELETGVPWESKAPEVCYVGGIASIRGISEVVSAMALTKSNTKLNLVGKFSEKSVETDVKGATGWVNVIEHGFKNRDEVRGLLGRSLAGIVTFHPVPNHVDAQPNKMFEYMSAGIPVIASDFPLWREIVIGNSCGLCVDPMDPGAIATAIDYIVDHPDEAKQMGENGRRAVLDRYNWGKEEEKLLGFYNQLLRG